jgi:hypothetical protein
VNRHTGGLVYTDLAFTRVTSQGVTLYPTPEKSDYPICLHCLTLPIKVSASM